MYKFHLVVHTYIYKTVRKNFDHPNFVKGGSTSTVLDADYTFCPGILRQAVCTINMLALV